MPRTYRIEATFVVHELDEIPSVAEHVGETSMSVADDPAPCSLAPITPEEIRAIRKTHNVSQTQFARHLNVTKMAVSTWECGRRTPTGATLKLLSIVQRKGLAVLS